MREWEAYSIKYIVPSRIRITTKGGREFSTMAACMAIASRKDRRNRNNDARKNAPLGKTSQSILVRRPSHLQATKMHGILWLDKFGSYIKLITDQDISVSFLERGTVRHPGHATPGGDGITPRDVEDDCLKEE